MIPGSQLALGNTVTPYVKKSIMYPKTNVLLVVGFLENQLGWYNLHFIAAETAWPDLDRVKTGAQLLETRPVVSLSGQIMARRKRSPLSSQDLWFRLQVAHGRNSTPLGRSGTSLPSYVVCLPIFLGPLLLLLQFRKAEGTSCSPLKLSIIPDEENCTKSPLCSWLAKQIKMLDGIFSKLSQF